MEDKRQSERLLSCDELNFDFIFQLSASLHDFSKDTFQLLKPFSIRIFRFHVEAILPLRILFIIRFDFNARVSCMDRGYRWSRLNFHRRGN